jgi:hypothetical protein
MENAVIVFTMFEENNLSPCKERVMTVSEPLDGIVENLRMRHGLCVFQVDLYAIEVGTCWNAKCVVNPLSGGKSPAATAAGITQSRDISERIRTKGSF